MKPTPTPENDQSPSPVAQTETPTPRRSAFHIPPCGEYDPSNLSTLAADHTKPSTLLAARISDRNRREDERLEREAERIRANLEGQKAAAERQAAAQAAGPVIIRDMTPEEVETLLLNRIAQQKAAAETREPTEDDRLFELCKEQCRTPSEIADLEIRSHLRKAIESGRLAEVLSEEAPRPSVFVLPRDADLFKAAIRPAQRLFSPEDEARIVRSFEAPRITKATKRARYTGKNVSRESIAWGGNDDPSPLLVVGQVYEIDRFIEHSWHTELYLEGLPGRRFNVIWFEPVPDLSGVKLEDLVAEAEGRPGVKTLPLTYETFEYLQMAIVRHMNDAGEGRMILISEAPR